MQYLYYTQTLRTMCLKDKDGRLYWAFEATCKKIKYTAFYKCDGTRCRAEEDCVICSEGDVKETTCDWSDIIPGPLMRELLKK